MMLKRKYSISQNMWLRHIIFLFCVANKKMTPKHLAMNGVLWWAMVDAA